MKGVPEIYTVLEWYRIAGEVVTFHCQNRRDNPSDVGPPYFDFPSLSILRYAGDGLFAAEEDFWEVRGARETAGAYATACEQAGVEDVASRLSRRHWPESPPWARAEAVAEPSWLARDERPGVLKPRELYALLGRERWTTARGV
jgi:hypothetical protein